MTISDEIHYTYAKSHKKPDILILASSIPSELLDYILRYAPTRVVIIGESLPNNRNFLFAFTDDSI